MHSNDYFINTIKKTAVSSQAFNSAGVTNGVAIDISSVESIAIFNEISAFADGKWSIQDVQFSSKSDFTSDVETFDSTKIDYLLANDRTPSASDPITQTLLVAVGTRKLCVPSLSKDGKKFFRARFLRQNGSSAVDFTANAIYILNYSKSPVVQS